MDDNDVRFEHSPEQAAELRALEIRGLKLFLLKNMQMPEHNQYVGSDPKQFETLGQGKHDRFAESERWHDNVERVAPLIKLAAEIYYKTLRQDPELVYGMYKIAQKSKDMLPAEQNALNEMAGQIISRQLPTAQLEPYGEEREVLQRKPRGMSKRDFLKIVGAAGAAAVALPAGMYSGFKAMDEATKQPEKNWVKAAGYGAGAAAGIGGGVGLGVAAAVMYYGQQDKEMRDILEGEKRRREGTDAADMHIVDQLVMATAYEIHQMQLKGINIGSGSRTPRLS